MGRVERKGRQSRRHARTLRARVDACRPPAADMARPPLFERSALAVGRWSSTAWFPRPLRAQWMLRMQRLTGDPGRSGTVTHVRRVIRRGRPGWPAAGSRLGRGARDVELPGGPDGNGAGRRALSTCVGEPPPLPSIFCSTAAAWSSVTWSLTTRPAASSPSGPIRGCSPSTRGSPPSTPSRPPSRTAGRRSSVSPFRLAGAPNPTGSPSAGVLRRRHAVGGGGGQGRPGRRPAAAAAAGLKNTHMAETSESRRLVGYGNFLTSEFVALAHTSYVTADQDLRDPLVSVRDAERAAGRLSAPPGARSGGTSRRAAPRPAGRGGPGRR